MTYEEIVSKTKEFIPGEAIEGAAGHLAVEVEITGEGSGVFYIKLKDGVLKAEPYDYHDRDCRLISSADTFFKICDGSLDAVAAYTVGKLKVDGSIEKALEFSKLVKTLLKDKKPAKGSKKKGAKA